MRPLVRPLAWAALLLWVATMDDGCARVVQWHQQQGSEFHKTGWYAIMPTVR